MTSTQATQDKPLQTKHLLKLGVAGAWLALWHIAAIVVDNSILLCGPLDVCVAVFDIVTQTGALLTLGKTALTILLSFFAAFTGGILSGMLAQKLPFYKLMIEPLVSVCKTVPVACMVVFLLIITNAHAVVSICIFMVVFPAIHFAAEQGLQNTNNTKSDFFRVFGIHGIKKFLALTWPSMMPFLYAACSTSLGMSWKSGIAAELIGIPLGTVGEQIYQAKITLATDSLLAWTVLIVVCAYACEKLFLALLRASEKAALEIAVRIPNAPHGQTPQKSNAQNNTVLRVENVCIGYKTSEGATKEVLRDVNFTLAQGEKLLLSQKSGFGKTSLLRSALGLLPPLSGRIVWQGKNTLPATAALFQQEVLFEELSALQNVMFPSGSAAHSNLARTYLSYVLPEEFHHQAVSKLSGGQRRRVELARTLAFPAELVVLDEPLQGIDDETALKCIELIEEATKDRCVVLASHRRVLIESQHVQFETDIHAARAELARKST